MRTIGLIGGMSCESTAHYYARLNERVRDVLGGLHSAEILMWSVDFAPVAQMQAEGRWQEAGAQLAAIAKRLEGAGAAAGGGGGAAGVAAVQGPGARLAERGGLEHEADVRDLDVLERGAPLASRPEHGRLLQHLPGKSK